MAKKKTQEVVREYPSIGEQLNMLFWDVKSGKDLKDGEWFKTILQVKMNAPKPPKNLKVPPES